MRKNIKLFAIVVLLLAFLLGCAEKEVSSKVDINTEKCSFDRNTPKLVKVWLIYGSYNVSLQPKKVYKFNQIISPPIPKVIPLEAPGAIVPFTYDNRVAIGLYDLPNKNLLYSNWAPIETSIGAASARGINYILSFLLPPPKNYYSIGLDPNKTDAKGFEGDLFVGIAVGSESK